MAVFGADYAAKQQDKIHGSEKFPTCSITSATAHIKSVVTKPQALTLTSLQSATKKKQPNPHGRVPNVTTNFQTKLVDLLPSDQLLNTFTFARSEVFREKQAGDDSNFLGHFFGNYLAVGANLEVCRAVWLPLFF